MRITVLVLAVITSFFLFLQSTVVGAFSASGSNEESAGAFGVLMALLMLISGAIVIPLPRVAMGLLALVGVIGLIGGTSSAFSDLAIWGGWALLLSAFSFFGYRGKVKQQAKEAERDAALQQSLAAQQQMAAQLAAMQYQQVGAPGYGQQYGQHQAMTSAQSYGQQSAFAQPQAAWPSTNNQ